jgi:hypothetical protein
VVALFGNGLHCLPGMGHSHCEHVEFFGSGGENQAFIATHFSLGECKDDASLNSDDDCPICHFLAQAKSLVTLPHLECNGENLCHFVTVYSPTISDSFHAAYRSRGPPCLGIFA